MTATTAADVLERLRHTMRYAPRFGEAGTPHGLELVVRAALEIDDPEVQVAARALAAYLAGK